MVSTYGEWILVAILMVSPDEEGKCRESTQIPLCVKEGIVHLQNGRTQDGAKPVEPLSNLRASPRLLLTLPTGVKTSHVAAQLD